MRFRPCCHERPWLPVTRLSVFLMSVTLYQICYFYRETRYVRVVSLLSMCSSCVSIPAKQSRYVSIVADYINGIHLCNQEDLACSVILSSNWLKHFQQIMSHSVVSLVYTQMTKQWKPECVSARSTERLLMYKIDCGSFQTNFRLSLVDG